MNRLVKYAIVGLAGYLIGTYEMKSKVIKTIAQILVEKESQENSKEEES